MAGKSSSYINRAAGNLTFRDDWPCAQIEKTHARGWASYRWILQPAPVPPCTGLLHDRDVIGLAMSRAANGDQWLWRKVTRYAQFLAPRESVFADPAVLAAARRLARVQTHRLGSGRWGP